MAEGLPIVLGREGSVRMLNSDHGSLVIASILTGVQRPPWQCLHPKMHQLAGPAAAAQSNLSTRGFHLHQMLQLLCPCHTAGLETQHPVALQLRGISKPQLINVPLGPHAPPLCPLNILCTVRLLLGTQSTISSTQLHLPLLLAQDQRPHTGTGPSPAAIGLGQLSQEGIKQVISPGAPHSHFSWASGNRVQEERKSICGWGGTPAGLPCMPFSMENPLGPCPQARSHPIVQHFSLAFGPRYCPPSPLL